MITNSTHRSFIELMQVAMGKKAALSTMPSQEEWDEIFLLSAGGSVEGICFQGVVKLAERFGGDYRKLNISGDTFQQWATISYSIVERNKIVTKQCLLLQRKMGEQGFATAIIKGQALQGFYGSLGEYRKPGDIDVWVDSNDEKVLDYVLKLTPTKEFDWKHMHFNAFRDTPVELHWIPSVSTNPIVNSKLLDYYKQQASTQCHNATTDAEGNPVLAIPDALFNSVYLLIHMYSHYVYERMNVRQLMDYYFVLETEEVQQNRNEIVQLLKQFGLYRFARLVMSMLKVMFDIDDSLLLCEPCSSVSNRSLSDLFNKKILTSSERNIDLQFIAKRLGRMLTYDKVGVVCLPYRKLQLLWWKKNIKNRFGI